MDPRILHSFRSEMHKLASERDTVAEDIKAKRRAELLDNAALDKAQLTLSAIGGGGLAASLALMKNPLESGGTPETLRRVQEMAAKMGLGAIGVSTPVGRERFSWNPAFLPKHNLVSIPVRTRDSLIAHELGHAKNFEALQAFGEQVVGKYYKAQEASRTWGKYSLIPTTLLAAGSASKSYAPGVIQAILTSPMIAEEVAASARATAHLIREHGVGKGLVKSLPLVPAFATYAVVAGAPLLITYLRRQAEARGALQKEKTSSDNDEGLSFFERHPKKVLGGAALAAGAGAYLLSKGKKSPHLPTLSSLPKKVVQPGKGIGKVVEVKAPAKRAQTPEWDQVAVGPDRKMPVEGYRRDKGIPAKSYSKGRHLELQDKAKMERKLEDEVVRANAFASKHAMAKLAMFRQMR